MAFVSYMAGSIFFLWRGFRILWRKPCARLPFPYFLCISSWLLLLCHLDIAFCRVYKMKPGIRCCDAAETCVAGSSVECTLHAGGQVS